jgi:hypothetical protein
MAETISTEQFWAEQLEVLEEGDLAFHAMLYPGVYPSDQKVHADAQQGIHFATDTPFYRQVDRMLARKVTIQWLRVMPDAGPESGYNDRDVDAMYRTAQDIAQPRVGARSIDVRTVRFSQHVGHLLDHCGEQSPIVTAYLDAINHPEQGPRRSFWATYRQRLGVLAITYFGFMDYEGEEFKGHEPHFPPLKPDTVNWLRFWRNTYLDHGERVKA